MPASSMPATIAVCCHLPEGCNPLLFEDWVRPVRAANVAVTWIVEPADLERMAECLEARGEADHVALDVPPDWFAADARQSIVRQRLAAVRRMAPALDAVVVRSPDGVAPLGGVRPELLVEYGIRLVAMKKLVGGENRRSRRPGPPGWLCRSPTWGLWEVGFSPKAPRGLLASLLPLSVGPLLTPGSLTVLHTGKTAGRSKREARQHFDRMVHWVARRVATRGAEAETVTLSQLASILLGDSGASGHRSVLAA